MSRGIGVYSSAELKKRALTTVATSAAAVLCKVKDASLSGAR